VQPLRERLGKSVGEGLREDRRIVVVVGRLGQDQVADYAKRKGWTLKEAERWLGSNLAYEPED